MLGFRCLMMKKVPQSEGGGEEERQGKAEKLLPSCFTDQFGDFHKEHIPPQLSPFPLLVSEKPATKVGIFAYHLIVTYRAL